MKGHRMLLLHEVLLHDEEESSKLSHFDHGARAPRWVLGVP